MADEKTNEKTKGKEPVRDRNEAFATYETSASTVASNLAGLFLEKQVRKGLEIEIPSLGIIIGKANLREANDPKTPDKSDGKEQPPDKPGT